MTDVNDLLGRIDREISAGMVQANREREPGLQRYETVAKHIIGLVEPRLNAFVERFKAVVEAEPILREHTRAVKLTFATTGAKVTLRFKVSPDRGGSAVRLECIQEIIPEAACSDEQPVLEFPLGGVIDEEVVRWFDDRAVAFVKAYLAVGRQDLVDEFSGKSGVEIAVPGERLRHMLPGGLRTLLVLHSRDGKHGNPG